MTRAVPFAQSRIVRFAFTITGALAIAFPLQADDEALSKRLPGTGPLTIKRPLDEIMVDGINRWCLRETAASRDRRAAKWNRDSSTNETYVNSIAPNRERFRTIIGAVDPRVTQSDGHRHEFELVTTLQRSSVVAQTKNVTAHRVRWPVLKGATAEGVLLMPKEVKACVVALPDADWTPEMFCGLTGDLPDQVQFARRLAEAGCLVAIPMLINRDDEFSGHPTVGWTNQPHREFLYRQAFEMGRHVIGYEVQKVLAAIDLFQKIEPENDNLPISVAGVGEGGLIAMYASAIDQRIDSTLVCGYFGPREDLWQEPIYRNVWSLLTEFGDAEIASLIAPRRLVIEASRAVEVPGPPKAQKGRRQVAAPGRIVTPDVASVRAEFERARKLVPEGPLKLVATEKQGAAGSPQAVAAFAKGLGVESGIPRRVPTWNRIANEPPASESAARQQRQFNELQTHVQTLLRLSPEVRKRIWKADLSSLEAWEKVRKEKQKWVHEELFGRLPTPTMPPNPRSRRVLKTDAYTGYEVMLDVFEDVIAGGILLLPHDLKRGEKRPVVVCQHGLEGLAMDTISDEPQAYRFYKSFADKLCRRGFIVYAPQNPYRGKDRFRLIQRKANPLKLSLFSFIIAQHEQTLIWLASLPNVDADRIAFYGLSYGGKTAMRVPPMIDRYCLSICSADFTDWVRSIATNEDRYGYIFTSEYEVPEWNMGHVAGYAELAMLVSPRPFMVEQGHLDGGAPTEWVTMEFGKVRRHYDLLGIGDRARIDLFNGPHTINGKRSFRLLDESFTRIESAQR